MIDGCGDFDGHDGGHGHSGHGGGDHDGGLTGVVLDIGHSGHGHSGAHLDMSHQGHSGPGHDCSDAGEGLDSMGGDFGGLGSVSLTDALLLSYDHKKIQPEDGLFSSGYAIVDGVVGNDYALVRPGKPGSLPPAGTSPGPAPLPVKLVVAPSGTGNDSAPASGKTPIKPVREVLAADPGGKRELSPAQLAYVKRVADDPRRQFFGVHVVNHGPIDLQTRFKALAKDHRLVRIDTVTPNFFGADDTQTQLADWDNWSPPYTRRRLPTGHYPSATGRTHVWKQYWQLEPRRWFWQSKPKGVPRYQRLDRTVLEVMVVQWYYREAGDFETRLHIKVVAYPILDRQTMRWGYLKEPFARHQAVARKLAELLLGCLKEAKPHSLAVSLRSKIEERKRMIRRRPSDKTEVGAYNQADVTPVDRVVDEGCPSQDVIPSGADLESALNKPKSVKVTVRLPVRKSKQDEDDGE